MKIKLLLLLTFFVSAFSWGQTFQQITTIAELTNGNYLIVGDSSTNDGIMLNSMSSGPIINYTSITNPTATISTGFTSDNIFQISVSGEEITIYNSSVGYVSWGNTDTGTANHAGYFNGVATDSEKWTSSVASGLWTLANFAMSTRILQWNNSSPRFAAYTSTQIKLKLYKEVLTAPTITLTPTSLTGFTYVVGNGPSAEQSFTATGINLTANVVLTAPSNYEISTTSGSGFGASVTLTQTGGNASGTIYVRLKAGLAVNSYNQNITATSTGAVSKSVALTGTVTGSQNSDIIAVPSSEATTIASTINNAAPLTASTGIQVWQFKVRDGGATLNDSDTLPTILTGFTLAQANGNAVDTWTDAIRTIALFDGTTFIATGTVTANQIQFSGLNVSVDDNTEKTLSLRLSLKCPLGADAFDGEDFMFSLSNANTSFGPTGSGKASFPAQTSTNNLNAISVTATHLAFEVQPITTGVNGPMSPAVKVKVVDACGNLDTDFSGLITVTSTGTMSPTPLSSVAINGIATYNNIIHTAPGNNYVLNASATGLTGATSTPFNIENITVLQPGDIAILAFNTNILRDIPNGNGDDEISFVALVDILPNTRIDITDNAFQKCGTPNGWGISEGWIRLQRANSILPAGTIVTIRVNTGGNPSIFSPDPSNWICSKPQPTNQGSFNLNNNGEQIFFMSGGTVGGPNTTSATSDAGTYSGNFLFGFNTKGNVWTPVCGNSDDGGTQNSDKPINFDCFLTWPTAQADLNKYTGPLTPTTKRDWISRINNPTNWSGYTTHAAYTAGPNYHTGSIVITTGGYSEGVWVGNVNDNWFDCGNWQALKIPDENVNVVLDSNSLRSVTVDHTAPYSDLYGDIAMCRNLTISNFSVILEGNSNNALNVYGNVTIDGSGSLDMDDGNPATTDGVLRLYGNWNNTVDANAFLEGNGTVAFLGNSPQTINGNNHSNVEEFYNVILGNNFNTTTNNNIIATNNLNINATKTLTIGSNDFVRINNQLNNSGNVIIESSGQLIQVNDSNTNIGTDNPSQFIVRRNYTAKDVDYVYWSSPVEGVSPTSLPNGYRYQWNTLFSNTNGTQGNWRPITATSMEKGKGYIARTFNGSLTNIPNIFEFSGKPHNGLINTMTVSRGNYYGDGVTTGMSYDAEPSNPNNSYTTRWDDNWNLVGNPYPSALNVEKFLEANTNLEGFVNIWTHNEGLSVTTDPFYYDFGYNYNTDDYITHNGTATLSGPAGFNGNIASGQGFFVLMSDGAPTTENIVFENDMRSEGNNHTTYNNSQFYRTGGSATTNVEKNRIWLDIISSQGKVNRTVVGYVTNATNNKDRLYDAVTNASGLKLYSFSDDHQLQEFCIQGRSLPFIDSDKVRLGFNATANGNYTIALSAIDGLFEGNQNIYLEDKQLNIIHDLKQNPYHFNAVKGTFNDRFILRYTTSALGNADFDYDNQVVVFSKNSTISINSSIQNIEEVQVYDVLGRTLYQNKSIDNQMHSFTKDIATQTIIVKVKLQNGIWITKKVLLK
jgi:hypothetical protein